MEMKNENKWTWNISNVNLASSEALENVSNTTKDLSRYSNNIGSKYAMNCASVLMRPVIAFVKEAYIDPMLLCITIVITIGSLCILNGLLILFMASKLIQDRDSETILLIAIGIFILSLAGLSWKLTSKRDITHFMSAANNVENV